MKKTILVTTSLVVAAIAASPIHDKMDSRIKGKSYSGGLDDNKAAEDGLGILPLQHHTGTADMNNELLVQKVFNKIVKSETDKTKTVNIRTSLTIGTVGTATDLSLLNNAGTTLSYISGTLSSCSLIKTQFPTSTSSNYILSGNKTVYCDMSGSGVAVYQPGSLASCMDIYNNYGISTPTKFQLSNGNTVTCGTDGNEVSTYLVGTFFGQNIYAPKICASGDYHCQAKAACEYATGSTCVYQSYDCQTGSNGSYYPTSDPKGMGISTSGGSSLNWSIYQPTRYNGSEDTLTTSYGNLCSCYNYDAWKFKSQPGCGVGRWIAY